MNSPNSADPGRAGRLSRRELFGYAGGLGAVTSLAVLTRGPVAFAQTPPPQINGIVHDAGGQVFDVRSVEYGAKGDAKVATGGSISSGSTQFTASTATFASGDVGKVITVQGAGASGGVLSATISSYTDSTHVTLSNAAATTVSGAAFAFGTDDTASIVAAITAAGARGVVFAPPGIYMITAAANSNAPITFAGAGGFVGGGGGSDAASSNDASTVLLCGDAGAGIVTIGPATYRGFRCDGNNISTKPLTNGQIVSGQAAPAGSGSTYIDVWSVSSTANGWTIYGTQHSSYYSCGSIDSAQDGLYIDGGAGRLEFHQWTESGSGRHGVRGAADVTGSAGTLGDRTEAIRFWGGSLTSMPNATTGVSKIHLRSAYDWMFLDVTIKGEPLSGPAVDLDQGAGNALSFARCRISAPTTGAQPGLACIRVGGASPANADPITFVTTDAVRFVAGDTSVYLAGVGNYRYSALDWICDDTENGPVAAAGLAGIETLLEGREGPWQTATLNSPWSGTVSYRLDEMGLVRLQGSATSSTGSGGAMFTLPPGYRPNAARQMLAALSAGFTSVAIGTDGAVTGGTPGSSTLHLDGIRFPLD